MQHFQRFLVVSTLGLLSILLVIMLSPQRVSAQTYQTAELEIDFINAYDEVWNDRGSGANRDLSIWRPSPPDGWYRVGHHAKLGYDAPTEATMVVRERISGTLANPTDYTLIWNDAGSGARLDGSVWRPVCPSGYRALGDVANGSHAKPSTDEVRCVQASALAAALPSDEIWNDAGSGARSDFGAWGIAAPAEGSSSGLFYGAASHARPANAAVEVLWAIKLADTHDPPSAPETHDPPSVTQTNDPPSGPTPPTVMDRRALNRWVAGLGSWEGFAGNLKPDAENRGTPATREVEKGDITYSCTETPVSLTRTPEKVVTFSPGTDALYVGSLLQGKGYLKGLGSLRELPIRQRGSITLSIPNLKTRDNAITVENPTVATIGEAVGELVERATRHGLDARAGSNISYSLKYVHSAEQAALELGFSAKYMDASVKSDFSHKTDVDEQTVMVHFIENMFTVQMVLPQTPADLFSGALTEELLEEQRVLGRVGSDNLPVYVASVTYGRVMNYSGTTTKTRREIEANLEAGYDGVVEVEANAALKQMKALDLRNTKLVQVGGQAEHALRAIRSGNISDFFTESNALQSARPISYTIHNVTDNSLAKVSETTNYTLTECTAKAKTLTFAKAGMVYRPWIKPNESRVHDSWGAWGNTEYCPENTYARGFLLKVEGEHEAGGDQSSLNGIKLFCSDGSAVTSEYGRFGRWPSDQEKQECPEGHALVGYSLKVEFPTGGDDTAANSLKMACRDLSQSSGTSRTLTPDPNTQEGKWGVWMDWAHAGGNQAICGLQTKVEEYQGTGGDDSMLNEVKFMTCYYDRPPPGADCVTFYSEPNYGGRSIRVCGAETNWSDHGLPYQPGGVNWHYDVSSFRCGPGVNNVRLVNGNPPYDFRWVACENGRDLRAVGYDNKNTGVRIGREAAFWHTWK